jgi:uncharacterized protein (DUF1778 family)
MERTSLSIRLSHNDALVIREQAAIKHCSVNEHVLWSVRMQVPFDDRLYKAGRQLGVSDALHTHRHAPIVGRRAVLHLRCSEVEASRIRRAAHRRRTTIGEYVVGCLKGSWGSAESGGTCKDCHDPVPERKRRGSLFHAKGTPDLMQRLPGLPSAPDLRPLGGRKV